MGFDFDVDFENDNLICLLAHKSCESFHSGGIYEVGGKKKTAFISLYAYVWLKPNGFSF